MFSLSLICTCTAVRDYRGTADHHGYQRVAAYACQLVPPQHEVVTVLAKACGYEGPILDETAYKDARKLEIRPLQQRLFCYAAGGEGCAGRLGREEESNSVKAVAANPSANAP